MQNSTVGYNTKYKDYKPAEYNKVHEVNKVHKSNFHQYGETKGYKFREYKPTSLEYKPTNYQNKAPKKDVKRLRQPLKELKKPRRPLPGRPPGRLYKYKEITLGPDYKIQEYAHARDYKGTEEYRWRPYRYKYDPYKYREYKTNDNDYKLTALNCYGYYEPYHKNDDKPRSADKVSVRDVKVRPRDENVPPKDYHPPPVGYQQNPQYGLALVGAAAVNGAPQRTRNEYSVKHYDKYREYNKVHEYNPHYYTQYHKYDRARQYDHIHEYCMFNKGGRSHRPMRAAQIADAKPEQQAKVAKEQAQKESGVPMKPAREYDKVHQYDKIHDYQSKNYVPSQTNSTKLGNDKTTKQVINKTETVRSSGHNAGGMALAAVAGGAAAGYVATNKSEPKPAKADVKETGKGKSKEHAFNDWNDTKKKKVPTATLR